MQNIELLINICKKYIRGLIELDEFQKQIEAIILPDGCKNTLEVSQHNACNKLEQIQYCYLPENQRQHANTVAEELIYAARNYLNKK